MERSRIVIIEQNDDTELVIREPAPANDSGLRLLNAIAFSGTGPARGEYETALAAEVEYFPPARRAA